ncbi:MAG: type II toxin-antitoxin system RelE/ParE family toxin [Deltaproteobacteria bacterium]|nr:type II toxin-antitoxin system RelE/ParE family toxin [Deltaproteobacteria bacterium]
MSKNYKILWTKPAQGDLEDVMSYIENDRPKTAVKLLEKIRLRAAALKKNPQRGRKLPELLHLPGIRFKELVITPWRLVYQIVCGEVHILAFLDSRRDLEDLLYERLTRVR